MFISKTLCNFIAILLWNLRSVLRYFLRFLNQSHVCCLHSMLCCFAYNFRFPTFGRRACVLVLQVCAFECRYIFSGLWTLFQSCTFRTIRTIHTLFCLNTFFIPFEFISPRISLCLPCSTIYIILFLVCVIALVNLTMTAITLQLLTANECD